MASLKIFTKTIEVTHWLFLYYIIQSEKHIEFLLPVFFSLHTLLQTGKKKSKTLMISALKLQKNYVNLDNFTMFYKIGYKW